MMRYLVRLTNSQGYTPRDVKMLQAKIRELLGSPEKIGNLRISTSAIEFDLFTEQTDLNKSKSLLQAKMSKALTLRPREPLAALTSEDMQTWREVIDVVNQYSAADAHRLLE